MADHQTQAFSQALGEVPIHSMLQSLGMGIADAQNALDAKSIELTRSYANTKIPLLDSTGTTVEHSLLDLGLVPTFYHFSEAVLEVAMSMSMRSEESLKVGVGIEVGGSFEKSSTTGTTTETTATGATTPSSTAGQSQSRSGGVMFGMSLNFEVARKFGFDASGATKIRAKLVTVPAPSVLLDAIQANAEGLRTA